MITTHRGEGGMKKLKTAFWKAYACIWDLRPKIARINMLGNNRLTNTRG